MSKLKRMQEVWLHLKYEYMTHDQRSQMMHYEQIQQDKKFQQSGLQLGDTVIDSIGNRGILYLSGAGFICVRIPDEPGMIWDEEFLKDR